MAHDLVDEYGWIDCSSMQAISAARIPHTALPSYRLNRSRLRPSNWPNLRHSLQFPVDIKEAGFSIPLVLVQLVALFVLGTEHHHVSDCFCLAIVPYLGLYPDRHQRCGFHRLSDGSYYLVIPLDYVWLVGVPGAHHGSASC